VYKIIGLKLARDIYLVYIAASLTTKQSDMKKVTVFEKETTERVILQEEYTSLSSVTNDGYKTRHLPGYHHQKGTLIEKEVYDRICKKKGRKLRYSIPERKETGETKMSEMFLGVQEVLIERIYFIP